MWIEAYGYRTRPLHWNQNSNPRLPEMGVDRLGFEPRTSCLQSRRSSADLPAPTRAQRRGADETFRGDSRSDRVRPGSTLIRLPGMKGRWIVPRTEPSDGLWG